MTIPNLPSWAKVAIRAGISVAILALLFAFVDFRSAIGHLAQINVWILIVAQALIVFQKLMTTWRWAIVLDWMRPPFAFSTACRIVFTAQFFGQVLPSAIGGDVLRLWYTRREGVPAAIAMNSIIIERVA